MERNSPQYCFCLDQSVFLNPFTLNSVLISNSSPFKLVPNLNIQINGSLINYSFCDEFLTSLALNFPATIQDFFIIFYQTQQCPFIIKKMFTKRQIQRANSKELILIIRGFIPVFYQLCDRHNCTLLLLNVYLKQIKEKRVQKKFRIQNFINLLNLVNCRFGSTDILIDIYNKINTSF
jgi:hypothetical protein